MREANVRLEGRILYLAEDPAFVRTQLAGEDPNWTPAIKLRDDISTDEITPAYICYYYDETLGEFPYLGLKRRGERQAAREGLVPRAVALRRDVRRHQTGCRGKHRAHLPRELPEPRRPDNYRRLDSRHGAPGREHSTVYVHSRRRRDHARHHRARRALQLQHGAVEG